MRLPVEPGDEAERMTQLFNRLMDSIQNEELARGRKADLLRAEEEAERLTALANATFEAIVISVRGRIIDGNHALEQLMGRPLDELKGTDMLGHLAEEDRERVREQLSQKESGPTSCTSSMPTGPAFRWRCVPARCCIAASGPGCRRWSTCATARRPSSISVTLPSTTR